MSFEHVPLLHAFAQLQFGFVTVRTTDFRHLRIRLLCCVVASACLMFPPSLSFGWSLIHVPRHAPVVCP